MQYDAETPSDYIEMLDEDWRKERVVHLRDAIKRRGPELVEGIKYTMLSFGDDEQTVFALNAQKNYVSLYVGDTRKVDQERSLLSKFNVGKGCIRLKKTDALPDEDLELFIQRTIDMWRLGKDIAC